MERRKKERETSQHRKKRRRTNKTARKVDSILKRKFFIMYKNLETEKNKMKMEKKNFSKSLKLLLLNISLCKQT